MTDLQLAQDTIKKAYNLLRAAVCTCDPEMKWKCKSCQARIILYKALIAMKKGHTVEQKEDV